MPHRFLLWLSAYLQHAFFCESHFANGTALGFVNCRTISIAPSSLINILCRFVIFQGFWSNQYSRLFILHRHNVMECFSSYLLSSLNLRAFPDQPSYSVIDLRHPKAFSCSWRLVFNIFFLLAYTPL